MADTDTNQEFDPQTLSEEFNYIDYEVRDNVAIIKVNRPDALNALNGEVLFELGAAFELAESDLDVKALVVTGEGKAFVAGADIADIQRIDNAFSGRELSLSGQDVMNTLAALPIPTIAAVNGFALGGGLELALAADLRVAGPKARLGLPEVGLGIIPGYGGTQRLPRLIGQGRALDLIMTGRHVQADEALELGLVNRIADDALEGALELAATIIKNAPISLGLAKEAVVRGLDVTLPQGLEVEADLFGLATSTRDATEGTTAFLEKRAPEFKNE